MASDTLLMNQIPDTGRVEDLPENFFLDDGGQGIAQDAIPVDASDEQEDKIPDIGHIKDLPEGFFVDEKPPVTIYDAEQQRTISAPRDVHPDKAIYLDAVQNKDEPEWDYLGYTRAAALEGLSFITAPGRGAVNFFAAMPLNTEASVRQQVADGKKEVVERGPRLSDLTGFLPFATLRQQAMAHQALDSFMSSADDRKDLLKIEGLEQSVPKLQKANADFIQSMGLQRPTDEESFLAERVLYDVGSGVSSLATALGLTVVTKNPTVAPMFFASLQKNDLYLRGRDADLSPLASDLTSTFGGVVEGALEYIGISRLMKALGMDRGVKRIVSAAATEFVQEMSQTGAEEAITQTAGIEKVDVVGGVQRALYSGLIGSIVGGGAGTLNIVQQQLAEEKIQVDAQKIVNVIEQRRPEVMQRLNQVIDDEASKPPNRAAQKRVQRVFEKYLKGEEVDVAKELEGLKGLKQEQYEAIVSGFNQAQSDIQQGINKAAREGRLRNLDREIGELDQDIDRLESQLVQADNEGRGTTRIGNKLQKLYEQREQADIERGELVTVEMQEIARSQSGASITDEDVATVRAFEGELDIKGQKLKSLGVKTNRQIVRQFQKTMRDATRIAQSDAKAAQELVINVLEGANLSAKDKSKFMRAVKNINSTEKALKELPKINSRISTLLEKAQRRELKNALGKILKSAKPKKQGAKPVGKMGDPDLQRLMDGLYEAYSLTKDAAAERINANLAAIENNQNMDADVRRLAMENKMLSIVLDWQTMSVDRISDVLVEVSEMVDAGRTEADRKDTERKLETKEQAAQLTEIITKGRDLRNISTTEFFDRLGKKMNEFFASESWLSNNWYDTLDMFFGKTEEGRALRDRYSGKVFEAVQEAKRLQIQYGNKFTSGAKKAFGISKAGKLQSKLMQDEIERKIKDSNGNVIEFEYADGVVAPWEISRAQARDLWMKLQMQDIAPTITSPDGNAISEQMINYLTEVYLTPEDIAFARSQMELYQEMKPQIDKVYGDMYGIYLPDIENYSPVRREYSESIGSADEFFVEMRERASSVPTFAKLRVANTIKIKLQSDAATMMRHISQAAHFVSMAETARELRSVFSNQDLRNGLDVVYGKRGRQIFDGYVEDFTVGHIRRAESLPSIFDKLNSNFATAVLAVKPNLFYKQMSSFVAYAGEIPTVDFMKGMASFAANPARAMREMYDLSVLIQSRAANQDVAFAENAIARSADLQGSLARMSAKEASLKDALLIFTRLGDRGAIYLGGWPLYQYHLKQGLSKEQAIKKFEQVTAMTQQSTDIDQLSRFQANRNPISRTFLMFMTAPLAYYRAQKRYLRQFSRGEISAGEAAKKAVIFNVIIPGLFAYISDAFNWDDDEEDSLLAKTTGLEVLPTNIERALLTSWTDGIFVVGPAMERIVAQGQGRYFGEQGFNFLQGPEGFAQSVIEGDLAATLEAFGYLSGYPIGTVMNQAEGAMDIMEGDVGKGALRMQGYTKSTAERATGDSGGGGGASNVF